MTTSPRRSVPRAVPTLVGLSGLAAVIAAGGHGWQLAASAVLAAALVVVDATRLRARPHRS